MVNKLDDFKKGEDSVTAAIDKVRKYLEDKGSSFLEKVSTMFLILAVLAYLSTYIRMAASMGMIPE